MACRLFLGRRLGWRGQERGRGHRSGTLTDIVHVTLVSDSERHHFVF